MPTTIPNPAGAGMAHEHAGSCRTRVQTWLAGACLAAANILVCGLLWLSFSPEKPATLALGACALLLLDVAVVALVFSNSKLRRSLAEKTNALAQIEAMFEGLNSNTVIGIYMVDDAMNFTYSNPQLARLLGYDQAVLANKFALKQVFPPKVYADICQHAKRRLSGRIIKARYECTALRKDGSPVQVEVFGSKIMLQGKAAIIGMMLDIDERKKAEAAIWHQAHYDYLTQLPNRQLFQQRLLQSIQQSDETGLPFALVFLDLDMFKKVNDSEGHLTGDLLLQLVAQRLNHCIRTSDVVARLGGDEFTLILQGLTSLDEVVPVCEKVLVSISQPYRLHDSVTRVSVSAGITFYPHNGQDSVTLLKQADLAMYTAKNNGRNQYCIYSSAMMGERQLVGQQ